MSWPQNPEDPRDRSPQGPPPSPQQPQPPQPGFGPPPAWPPTGAQPPAQYPQQPGPYPGPQPGPHQGPPPGPHQGAAYGFPQQPYGGGYAQQPQYAAPPPPPPAPRKRRTGLVVTGAVVAVALVAVGVTLGMRGHGKHHTVAGPSVSPRSTAAGPTPSEAAPGLSNSSAKPLVPGWQTQAEASHGFAYDVPPASAKWRVNAVDQDLAYTDKNNNPVVVMSGSAEYHLGGCVTAGKHTGPVQAGTGQLATVGEQGSTQGTLQVNARNVAGNWLFAAYGGAGGHKPGHIQVTNAVPWNHNGIKGYMAKGTATGIYRPSACVPARAVSYGISMRLPDGSIGLWVMYADQGVPDALTAAQMKAIMDTVRPYTGS